MLYPLRKPVQQIRPFWSSMPLLFTVQRIGILNLEAISEQQGSGHDPAPVIGSEQHTGFSGGLGQVVDDEMGQMGRSKAEVSSRGLGETTHNPASEAIDR
ncbi:MAG: hypothetical protein IPL86_11965 [Flavobacteriales bacterium]|nr:hypothetical protein [Flavobacteriales bacterium]